MKFGANDVITVLGTRGTGKSTLARRISAMWPRKIIIDPVEDWTDGKAFSNFNSFSNELINLKKENKKDFKLIFRFDPDCDNNEEVFNHVLRLAYHFKNVQVIIDEVQLFSSPHFASKYLKNNLFIGRHNGISMLPITQRPGQLNKNILAQSQHVFCGQLHEKNDLNVVSEFMNIPREEIINLKKGEFFWFSPGVPIKKIKIFEENKIK